MKQRVNSGVAGEHPYVKIEQVSSNALNNILLVKSRL